MKKTLVKCKTYQEAILVMNERKAHPAIRKNVELAYKIADPDNKILPKMLQEMEHTMQKDDDDNAKAEMEHENHEEDKKKLAEMIHEREDDQGDGRKTGEDAQSDGSTLDDVAPPGDGSHDAQQNAQQQKGTVLLSLLLPSSSLPMQHVVSRRILFLVHQYSLVIQRVDEDVFL